MIVPVRHKCAKNLNGGSARIDIMANLATFPIFVVSTSSNRSRGEKPLRASSSAKLYGVNQFTAGYFALFARSGRVVLATPSK